jgi:hypothetical protein
MNNMKRSLLLLMPIVLWASAPLCNAQEGTAYKIRCQIFRVQDNLSGDTSLTDAIWPEGKAPEDGTQKDLTWFTIATLKIGSKHLDVGKNGWSWDTKPIGWDDSGSAFGESSDKGDRTPLSFVAAPTVIVGEADKASLRLGSDIPFEYFEKASDHAKTSETLYALRRAPVETGFELQCTPRKQGDRILLDGLTFRLLSVGEREPVDGVTMLMVGKPIQKEIKVETSAALKLNADYGALLMPGEGQGLLLIRIRVDQDRKGK